VIGGLGGKTHREAKSNVGEGEEGWELETISLRVTEKTSGVSFGVARSGGALGPEERPGKKGQLAQ